MARGGPERTWRGYGVLAAVPLLLATACGGGGGGPAKTSPSATGATATGATATGRAAPGATDGPVVDADPARLPATRKAARALIGKAIAGPDDFGPGVVARTPYESGPDTWPVLGTDCVWQQRPPGHGILATLARSFEIPAARSKGPLRLAAVMTVHRADDGARWEMAESLEETMRCPTQQLRQGESISGVGATALALGEGGQVTSDDSLMEDGQYRSAELGGPYPYVWMQSQTLRFTYAVTARGGEGWARGEIDEVAVRGQAAMMNRLGDAIGRKG
ncbi:hypothetical protein ACFU6R_07395 [Streptomyces sp. NPDC057499]|uniref:hypothetical protein n=1 Tax=Streptomyces sp. NPDC057499 TaxID=3346150 RepID=UPI0036A833A7